MAPCRGFNHRAAPPDILAAKAAAARGLIAANAVAGLIELDPALALRGLKEGIFDDDLPAADRKSLRARAELGQIRERTAAGADGARRLVALEGAIGRGEAGEQAIAEAADILDDPTRARMRERLDARRADDAARNRRIETVSAVLAGRARATGEGQGDVKPDGGGEDLRPGAPGWRQAVDDHYASLADTLETMDPDERARFEDDYARATGVLPGPVLKQVRAGLLSDDPAAQAAAAQRLVRLKDGNPGRVFAIPADERRRAQDIAGFVDLGLPAPRAVELAEKKLAQQVLPTEDLPGNTTLIGDVRVGSEEGIPVVGPGGTPDTGTRAGGERDEGLVQEGEVEDDAKTAQADNAKSMPQSQGKPVDPWPASPVRPKFRDELHKRESKRKNYQEEVAGQAWGRYQMTKPALKDLGMMDAKGNWTGKHGIHDKDEFLNNPKVQEKVLAEYMKRNLDQLRANGALGDMGQKISGVKA